MVNLSSWSIPRSRREQPPYFTKGQIITVLEQVGILLQLDGANPFRVRAYENASRSLSSHEEDLWETVNQGRLIDIKGIGKGIAGLINEAMNIGTWGDLGSLYEKVPRGLIEMLDLKRPIYQKTAAYGHFGRDDIDLPWEKTDKLDVLKKYL